MYAFSEQIKQDRREGCDAFNGKVRWEWMRKGRLSRMNKKRKHRGYWREESVENVGGKEGRVGGKEELEREEEESEGGKVKRKKWWNVIMSDVLKSYQTMTAK